MSPRKKATSTTDQTQGQRREAEGRVAIARVDPAVLTGTSAGGSPATAEPAYAGPVISAPPRPLARPREDVFAAYEAGMREKGADLYRRMKVGPVRIMSVESAYPEVVQWLRRKGVLVEAHWQDGNTHYSIKPAPEGV